MSETATLNQSYNFSTVVPWYGRVNFTGMKLIATGTYNHITSVPRLITNLEAIRSSLPDHPQSTDFRDIEYLSFSEEAYDSASASGTTATILVVPTIFISDQGLVEVNTVEQPKIVVNPNNREEYNLVVGALRDLNISFELRTT